MMRGRREQGSEERRRGEKRGVLLTRLFCLGPVDFNRVEKEGQTLLTHSVGKNYSLLVTRTWPFRLALYATRREVSLDKKDQIRRLTGLCMHGIIFIFINGWVWPYHTHALAVAGIGANVIRS